MNTTFNYNRFKMVMRWNFLSKWTKYVRAAAGLMFGMILYCMLTLYSLGNKLEYGWSKYADPLTATDKEFFFNSNVHQGVGVFLLILFFFFIFFAAQIFANMKTKQQRVAFLMLPATKLEKYLACFVSVTLASIIGWAVAAVAADAVQYLFSFYFTPGWHGSIISEMISRMGDIPWETYSTVNGQVVETTSLIPGYTCLVAGIICLHSFYVLGGAFFRRHPALLTLCVQFILILLFVYASVEMKDCGIAQNLEDNTILYPIISYTLSVVLLLIAGCFHWLAFKFFSRMQVINNKWINV